MKTETKNAHLLNNLQDFLSFKIEIYKQQYKQQYK